MAISPQFYTDANIRQTFLGGNRRHYLQKDRTEIISSYTKVLDYGEDMYSLAKDIFGEANQRQWALIADINQLRFPEDWEAGEIVTLPEIIISEASITLRTIRNEQSSSTAI